MVSEATAPDGGQSGRRGPVRYTPDNRRRAVYVLVMWASSIGLSVVSFYTTFHGFSNFLNPYFAAPTTFAIQALMLVSAWQLGAVLFSTGRYKGPRLLGFSLIFAVCFALSGFFSFAKLFDTVAGEGHRERTQIAQLLSFYDEVRQTSVEKLSQDVSDTGEQVTTSNAYVAWKAKISTASEAATRLPDEVREAQSAQAASTAASNRRADSIETEIQSLERRVGELRDTDRARRAVLENAALAVSRLQARIRQAEAEMDAQIRGLGGRIAGRGAGYDSAERQRREAVEGLPAAEVRLTQAEVDVAAVRTALKRAETELEAAQGELARVAPNRDASNTLGDMDDVLKSLGAAAANSMQRDVNAFEATYDRARLEVAINRCRGIKEALIGIPAARAAAEALTCMTPELSLAMKPLQTALDRRGKFADVCPIEARSVAGAPPRGPSKPAATDQAAPIPAPSAGGTASTDLPQDRANENTPTNAAPEPGPPEAAQPDSDVIINSIRQCIVASSISGPERQEVTDQLQALSISVAGGAQKFSSVVNGVVSGNLDARLAVAVAAVIDLLVLVCGLVGESARRHGADASGDRGAARTPMAKATTAGKVEQALRRTEMGFDGSSDRFRQNLILALGLFQTIDERGRSLAVLPQPVADQSEDVVMQVGRGLLMHLHSLGLAEANGHGGRGDMRYAMDADVLDALWRQVDDKPAPSDAVQGGGWSIPQPKLLSDKDQS